MVLAPIVRGRPRAPRLQAFPTEALEQSTEWAVAALQNLLDRRANAMYLAVHCQCTDGEYPTVTDRQSQRG
jgi:hypothetical protein